MAILSSFPGQRAEAQETGDEPAGGALKPAPAHLHVPRSPVGSAGILAALAAGLAALLLLGACGGTGTPKRSGNASAQAHLPLARNGELAFVRETGGDASAASEILVVRPDGSGLRSLVVPRHPRIFYVDPAWSPDGQRLALTKIVAPTHEYSSLVVAPASGGAEARLRGQTNETIFNDQPSWSPDGRSIVYAADGELIITGPEAPSRPLADTQVVAGDAFDAQPTWSPDGRWICFVRNQSGPELRLVRPDWSGEHPLGVSGTSPDWSPDGKRIVFGRRGALYMVNEDGSKLVQLTEGTQSDVHPSWSPDGRWIAFIRERSEAANMGDLWLVRPDGSGAKAIAHGAKDVDWQPLVTG